MSSHITSDLEHLATHTGILKDGELVFEGTKGEVIQAYAPDSDFEAAIISAFKIGNQLKTTKTQEEFVVEEGK